MAWTPRGYIHVRQWADAEVKRRGQEDTNANWSRAFDDLANYLADEDDPEESQNALFVFESGGEPHPVPLHEWRQKPDKRGELLNSRVYRNYNVMGFGSGEFGRIVIREALRITDIIDIEPDAVGASELLPAPPSVPAVSTAGRGAVSHDDLHAFLTDLDREFQGKTPPSLDTIGKRGVAQFGKAKWRKNNRDQRNAVDEKGDPRYPNLFCTTPGKR
jgi:hypothetical protein